jgi:hypothetical protein
VCAHHRLERTPIALSDQARELKVIGPFFGCHTRAHFPTSVLVGLANAKPKYEAPTLDAGAACGVPGSGLRTHCDIPVTGSSD